MSANASIKHTVFVAELNRFDRENIGSCIVVALVQRGLPVAMTMP